MSADTPPPSTETAPPGGERLSAGADLPGLRRCQGPTAANDACFSCEETSCARELASVPASGLGSLPHNTIDPDRPNACDELVDCCDVVSELEQSSCFVIVGESDGAACANTLAACRRATLCP